jgi:cysteine desulfurase
MYLVYAPNPMIYLDNGATTRLCAEAREALLRYSLDAFANPSSAHRPGIAASRGLKDAREAISRAIGAEPSEIVLTSGGTEADGLAVIGAARASRGRHVLASAIEHPAVLGALKVLEADGFSCELVPVSRDGLIEPDTVAERVRDDTALVSTMMVNNEIGTQSDVREIGRAVRRKNQQALVHVDAVQALGKVPLRVGDLEVDLVSMSAHKLHGPKGVGALWVRRGVRLQPLWGGGGQEGGARPGTENVAGAAAFAAAVTVAAGELPEAGPRMARMRDRFVARVREAIPGVVLIGHAERRAPHNACLGFPGQLAEVLLHALEDRGVIVSAGAACSSRERKASHVLKALGVPDDLGVLRVTLSRETTGEEIELAAEALADCARALRA